MGDHWTRTAGPFRAGRDRDRWASAALCWLASHRDRLTVWTLGGRKLVLMVVWDREGATPVERDDVEIDAIRRIVYGPPEEQQSPGGHPAASHPEAYPTSVPGQEGGT